MNAGVLSDLFRTGAKKPLAYLPLFTIRDVCGFDPSFIQDVLENDRGMETLLLENADCFIASGALYAWHENSLKKLLDKNREILKAEGWPVEPLAFVCHVSCNVAPVKTRLFDVVADAFGDKTNPGRTDIPAPPGP